MPKRKSEELPVDETIKDPLPGPPPEEAPYGYKSDGTPRKRPGRAKVVGRREDQRLSSDYLKKILAEIASFPAVPVTFLPLDPPAKAYLTAHFSRTGPYAAEMLVQASETSPRLRAVLERIASGNSTVNVVVGLSLYLVPPVLFLAGGRQQALRLSIGLVEKSQGSLAAKEFLEEIQALAATQPEVDTVADDGTQSTETGISSTETPSS